MNAFENKKLCLEINIIKYLEIWRSLWHILFLICRMDWFSRCWEAWSTQREHSLDQWYETQEGGYRQSSISILVMSRCTYFACHLITWRLEIIMMNRFVTRKERVSDFCAKCLFGFATGRNCIVKCSDISFIPTCLTLI